MKPPIPPPDPSSAQDALFDQIERELALLTTASLDAADRMRINEFAGDFHDRSALPPTSSPRRLGPKF